MTARARQTDGRTDTAAHFIMPPIELVQEIGRRTTAITEDARESVFVPAPLHGPSTRECGIIIIINLKNSNNNNNNSMQ